MDAPPAWRHACMFAKHGKQTEIALTPAMHNAASPREKKGRTSSLEMCRRHSDDTNRGPEHQT